MEDGGGGDVGGDVAVDTGVDLSADVGADASSSLEVPMADDVLESAEATGELDAPPEAADLLGEDLDAGVPEAPPDLDAVAATGAAPVGDLPEELEPPVYHPSRDLPADLVPDQPADPSQPNYRPYDPVVHTDRTIERGGGAAYPEGEPGRGGLNVPPEGWRPGGPERG